MSKKRDNPRALPPLGVMGMDEIGGVEAGKRADLISIAGDPLGDMRNTRNVGSSSRTERCIARPNGGRAWDMSLKSEVGRTSFSQWFRPRDEDE